MYQIEPMCLELLRTFFKPAYKDRLAEFVTTHGTLAARYAKERQMSMIPLMVERGVEIALSPGAHRELIVAIRAEFGPRFVPGGKLVYVGDTGDKWGYFDRPFLSSLGVDVDNHGKMPDAVIYYPEKDWLVLAEAVTSHGPVDAKRHDELQRLFRSARPGLVFVSAFPTRRVFVKYLEAISWETEVWVADSPSHLIHFNGAKFLGPYQKA